MPVTGSPEPQIQAPTGEFATATIVAPPGPGNDFGPSSRPSSTAWNDARFIGRGSGRPSNESLLGLQVDRGTLNTTDGLNDLSDMAGAIAAGHAGNSQVGCRARAGRFNYGFDGCYRIHTGSFYT